jgi:hypothetical protein
MGIWTVLDSCNIVLDAPWAPVLAGTSISNCCDIVCHPGTSGRQSSRGSTLWLSLRVAGRFLPALVGPRRGRPGDLNASCGRPGSRWSRCLLSPTFLGHALVPLLMARLHTHGPPARSLRITSPSGDMLGHGSAVTCKSVVTFPCSRLAVTVPRYRTSPGSRPHFLLT